MTRIPRIAIIPSTGRPCLQDCLDAIKLQVDGVVIVSTNPEFKRLKGQRGYWVEDVEEPKNISRWWNKGLDAADSYMELTAPAASRFDVAILNDDVIVPTNWFTAVASKMREIKAVAGCSGGKGVMPVLHTRAGQVDLSTRMQGFAFVVAGEVGLRFDEGLQWWFGDDDFDWRARQAGGMVMIPGFEVNHLYPNGQMTAALHAQTGIDGERFQAKWGMRPW